jgi:hypothetical protein
LFVLARKTVVAAIQVAPEISKAGLIREIEDAVRFAKIKGRSPKTYGRWVEGFKNGTL